MTNMRYGWGRNSRWPTPQELWGGIPIPALHCPSPSQEGKTEFVLSLACVVSLNKIGAWIFFGVNAWLRGMGLERQKWHNHCGWAGKYRICSVEENRVADVEGPRDRRYPKGQGLLRKEGPPTYAILSRLTCFMNGRHRAFYESHPSLGVFSTKVS